MEISETTNNNTRSTFITVVAWIFIVMSGFSTLISVAQNAMLAFMLPPNEMHNAMNSASSNQNIPLMAQFMINHFQLIFVAFLLVSVGMLITSIALLKRRNWARLIFICMLMLGIFWNLAGVLFQSQFFSSINATNGANAEFEQMARIMLYFTMAISIGVSLLFGWLIKRFTSESVKKEFQRNVL